MASRIESMAFSGQKPWHGLGVEVPKGTSVDGMLKAAGLDWEIVKVPNYVPLPKKWSDANPNPDDWKDKTFVRNDRSYSLVRTSDNKIISAVGEIYKPIQNRKAFEVFDRFVKTKRLHLETAGSVRDGMLIWALASINKDFTLAGGDEVKGYVLLSQSHEYGEAMRVAATGLRKANWSTYIEGLEFAFSHASVFDDQAVREAYSAIDLAETTMDAYKEKASLLAKVEFSEKMGIEFLFRTLQKKETHSVDIGNAEFPASISSALDSKMASTTLKNMLRKVYTQPGADLKSGGNSAWNWFNVVSYSIDHLQGRERDTSIYNAMFSVNAKTKKLALDNAVAMAQTSNLRKRAA